MAPARKKSRRGTILPMSDQPVTVSVLTETLAAFHRDVILPDVQRVVQDILGSSVGRLRDELLGHIDGLGDKVVGLEQEMRFGFAQADDRLKEVEARLTLRVEVLADEVNLLNQRLAGS